MLGGASLPFANHSNKTIASLQQSKQSLLTGLLFVEDFDKLKVQLKKKCLFLTVKNQASFSRCKVLECSFMLCL